MRLPDSSVAYTPGVTTPVSPGDSPTPTRCSKPIPSKSARGLCGSGATYGSGLSPLYGLLLGLTLAAALGWPYVLVFVLIVGPAVGAQHALSPRKGTGSSA